MSERLGLASGLGGLGGPRASLLLTLPPAEAMVRGRMTVMLLNGRPTAGPQAPFGASELGTIPTLSHDSQDDGLPHRERATDKQRTLALRSDGRPRCERRAHCPHRHKCSWWRTRAHKGPMRARKGATGAPHGPTWAQEGPTRAPLGSPGAQPKTAIEGNNSCRPPPTHHKRVCPV